MYGVVLPGVVKSFPPLRAPRWWPLGETTGKRDPFYDGIVATIGVCGGLSFQQFLCHNRITNGYRYTIDPGNSFELSTDRGSKVGHFQPQSIYTS